MYDTTAGIPAVIEETGPVYYIREPNGSLIARIDGETVNYYHFDALGSTRLLTNSSGAVTDEYTYDAWGTLTNRTEHTGSVDQPYQFVGQLGYYTHVQDASLPLLQLGVRFYDPAIGRFTQVDPEGEGFTLYAYVGNRPTVGVDPSGEAVCIPWPAIAKAIAIISAVYTLYQAAQCIHALIDMMNKACELRDTWCPPEDTAGRWRAFHETPEFKRALKQCPDFVVGMLVPI